MKSVSIDELVFEPKDTEIFKIPDMRTRIGTVQNYFFPRLEKLLKHTCSLIQQIYKVNPYERTTFVYRPSNRKDARNSSSFYEVYIGLSGKRRLNRRLNIRKLDGTQFFFHPTYLTYNIDLRGGMRVELWPFRYQVDSKFVETVAQAVNDNIEALTTVCMLNHISYGPASSFIPFKDSFSFEKQYYRFFLFSPLHWFPIKVGRSLKTLALSFAALYPLLDACISIAECAPCQLSEMLNKFKNWCLSEIDDEDIVYTKKENQTDSEIMIPELDSYSFVRPGLWWTVLARDNWKCCSCGRSSQEDGITLEVDHIIPRSKGGTNNIENLQTLCKKCNIGKSNKDIVDLRQSYKADNQNNT